jgi:hypothetical protein
LFWPQIKHEPITDQLMTDDYAGTVSRLAEHLESHLGAVLHEWAEMPDLLGMGVRIRQHHSAPHGVALTLATLGLSKHALRSANSGETIHQELLFFASRPAEPFNLPALLAQIVNLTISRTRAISSGDILGPAGELLKNSRMEALCAVSPILVPPEFVAEEENGRGIGFVWLLPITAGEATWAREHGWQAFEEELDRQLPDKLDWYRGEMALGRSSDQ